MVRRLTCLSVAMATSLLTVPSAAQPVSGDWPYAVFELPTLGGDYSYGWTLDESGNVVGSAYLPGNRVVHPTAWLDGQIPINLGTLGGEDGSSRGINENGWIIGRAQTPGQGGPDFSAFLWRNGQMENLGHLGGEFAEAYGVNDHGQIVGWSATAPPRYGHAFLWEDGEMIDLGVMPGGGLTSQAIAINNAGLIVGQANSPIYETWRPVIWQDGEIIDLGTFRPDNGGVGICIDVNEAGDVVGYCHLTFSYYRAFIYRNGEKHMLPVEPFWRNSYAWSINEHRQIVGGCRIPQFGNQSVGVIWEWNKPVRYLARMIPPESNWFFGSALSINNAGQITGTGFRLDDLDYTKGFFLSPVKPTMEMTAPSPGIAGMDNTLTISGAPPGAQVEFFYSRRGGGTAIDGCTTQQNALQLDEPILIGSVIADENGRARVTHEVPASLRGRAVLMQAAVEEACAVSQLVVYRFE